MNKVFTFLHIVLLILISMLSFSKDIMNDTYGIISNSYNFNKAIIDYEKSCAIQIKSIQFNVNLSMPNCSLVIDDSNIGHNIFIFIDDNGSATIGTPGNSIKAMSCSEMFANLKALETIDLSGLDISGVTSMRSMFRGCESLKEFDIKDMDTSRIQVLFGMFYNCTSIKRIHFRNLNLSSLTSAEGFANSCISLREVDFINTPSKNLKRIDSMFSDCWQLEDVNLSGLNFSNATNTNSMFYNCKSLEYLDLHKFKFSNVANSSEMFKGCESMKYLNISRLNTKKNTHLEKMFYESFQTNGIIKMGRNFVIKETQSTSEMFTNTGDLKIKGSIGNKTRRQILSMKSNKN